MRTVIGKFFTDEKQAMRFAAKQEDIHKGRTAFYVACFKNGFLVLNEDQVQ